MKPGEAQELVETLDQAREPGERSTKLLQGTVTAVGTNVITVDFGSGGIPDLHFLSWYVPVVGDVVWAVENGADVLVIGPLDPTGPEEYALTTPYVKEGAREGTTRPDNVLNVEGGISVRAVLSGDGYPTSGTVITVADGNYFWQMLIGRGGTYSVYTRGGDGRFEWGPWEWIPRFPNKDTSAGGLTNTTRYTDSYLVLAGSGVGYVTRTPFSLTGSYSLLGGQIIGNNINNAWLFVESVGIDLGGGVSIASGSIGSMDMITLPPVHNPSGTLRLTYEVHELGGNDNQVGTDAYIMSL